jgi:hypothetical protein
MSAMVKQILSVIHPVRETRTYQEMPSGSTPDWEWAKAE